MDPLTQALVSAGPGGLIAATIFYFYRGKESELVASRAETAAARDKIDSLQLKIQEMLQAQIENEPKRRETLDSLKRLVEEQGAALKVKVPQ